MFHPFMYVGLVFTFSVLFVCYDYFHFFFPMIGFLNYSCFVGQCMFSNCFHYFFCIFWSNICIVHLFALFMKVLSLYLYFLYSTICSFLILRPFNVFLVIAFITLHMFLVIIFSVCLFFLLINILSVFRYNILLLIRSFFPFRFMYFW